MQEKHYFCNRLRISNKTGYPLKEETIYDYQFIFKDYEKETNSIIKCFVPVLPVYAGMW
ncbi:hypothetical protein LPYR103PRE_08260 [Segatella asaccharophila]|jgi:hypothetical protein